MFLLTPSLALLDRWPRVFCWIDNASMSAATRKSTGASGHSCRIVQTTRKLPVDHELSRCTVVVFRIISENPEKSDRHEGQELSYASRKSSRKTIWLCSRPNRLLTYSGHFRQEVALKMLGFEDILNAWLRRLFKPSIVEATYSLCQTRTSLLALYRFYHTIWFTFFSRCHNGNGLMSLSLVTA